MPTNIYIYTLITNTCFALNRTYIDIFSLFQDDNDDDDDGDDGGGDDDDDYDDDDGDDDDDNDDIIYRLKSIYIYSILNIYIYPEDRSRQIGQYRQSRSHKGTFLPMPKNIYLSDLYIYVCLSDFCRISWMSGQQ